MPIRANDERLADAQRLAPGLYIVATPIGNLEDITLRALRVLRQADLIACEDTRHTQKLLNHFGITTPTQSYHEHNEARRAQDLVERIAGGGSVALVSDAGMPGISDPGAHVIQAAVARRLKVVAIPGPSALVTALVTSGLPTERFHFVGFLPARSGERRNMLEELANVTDTLIFYEAPHRIGEMLLDLEDQFGSDRQVVIARELTKVHEEFLRGTAAELAKELAKRATTKGEITVVVSGKSESQPMEGSKADLVERIRELMVSQSLEERDALKRAAREFGLSKSETYREWQRRKKSGLITGRPARS